MYVPIAVARRLRPTFLRTGNACFPLAARMLGSWWVLRVNGFPDHPLYTLFVDGRARSDLEDLPSRWKQGDSLKGPQLEGSDQLAVMDPVVPFEAYGSERGEPCQGVYCCG